MLLWKLYVWVFFVINAVSLAAFDYKYAGWIALLSLVLSILLNIAVFSYAYKKTILPKIVLEWLFKINIGLYGLFLLFEFITFIQEAVGSAGLILPTSGFVSLIASFPAFPAIYATYKLVYKKPTKLKKSKPKGK